MGNPKRTHRLQAVRSFGISQDSSISESRDSDLWCRHPACINNLGRPLWLLAGKMPAPQLLILMLAALLAAGTGCEMMPRMGGSAKIGVFADGYRELPATTVVTDTELYDASANRVSLFGALNEVIDFRVEVSASGSLNARVGDFTGPGGATIAGNVALYQVHHVRVDEWPGWHVRRYEPDRRVQFPADVLVPASAPRGGLPTMAEPRRPVKLWADVHLPRGTLPGEYSAPLEIMVNGKVAQRIDIALSVLPFALPDDVGTDLLVDVDQRALFAHHVRMNGKPVVVERILADHPASADLSKTLTHTMRLLRDNRLTPQLPGLTPVVKMDADGRLDVDWSDYDRVVRPFIDGDAFADRRPLARWCVPLDEGFPDAAGDGTALSPLYARLLHDYLTSATEHLREHGWLSRAYVRIPFSQRMTSVAQAATHHFGYILRREAPELAAMSTLFPQDMTAYGWSGFDYVDLRDDVDIWAPRAQYFDRSAITDDLGARAWMTVDRPPFSGTTSVAGQVADSRAIPWQARTGNVQAIRVGLANHWPAPQGRPVNPQECVMFDPDALVFPGALFGMDAPVASVRLKRLRRGMQDLAYLSILSAKGKGHIANTLVDSLAPRVGAQTYGVHFADGGRMGWEDDPRLWRMARRIMADELLSAVGGGPAAGDTLPTTLRWQRFMELTRRLELSVTGVRVQPAGGQTADGVEVVCTVALRNGGRTPVAGKLSFADLPVGWTAVPDSRHVPRIDPGGTRNIVLSSVTGALAWNTGGIRELPVVFESEDGVRREIPARLSHLTAAALPGQITLDGDLQEWPTGVGNDAADFAPITGEKTEAGVRKKPAHGTLCFVGLRDNALCFAVRCELTPGTKFDLRRRPHDVPDDLVPIGAESVEILLDPTNAGTPSTADVYRIVVSPGGAFWQHGVATQPPTSRLVAWPVNIRHAVQVAGDHWSAEVEVPLDIFPEVARRHSIWGMNITRFDLESQEYSNWSGAVGNAYNPQTLGNLTIP